MNKLQVEGMITGLWWFALLMCRRYLPRSMTTLLASMRYILRSFVAQLMSSKYLPRRKAVLLVSRAYTFLGLW